MITEHRSTPPPRAARSARQRLFADSPKGPGAGQGSASGSPHATSSSPAPNRVGGGTETILYVEDDGAVRALAASILRSHGYTILEAGDGPQALERARSHQGQIHLLVADMILPGMCGQELAAHLLTERPTIKVLFSSGYTDEYFSYQGGPGTAFLQKPFSASQLAGKVREVLDAATDPRSAS